MAAQDEDCYCELPLNMSDDELEFYSRLPRLPSTWPQSRSSASPCPTTGFLAFARLCRIAGKIRQLNSPRRVREVASASPGKSRRFRARVDAHDRALRSWMESLPDSVRFSGSAPGGGAEGYPHSTMGVIIFVVHAGSLLNLYRQVL